MEGTVVGTTSSVAYGHSVGSILAFAYVKPEAVVAGCKPEVVIMGEARKAKQSKAKQSKALLGGDGVRSGKPLPQE